MAVMIAHDAVAHNKACLEARDYQSMFNELLHTSKGTAHAQYNIENI